MGRIEADSTGRLRITFRYDPGLVAVVRGFRGRRWDPGSKAWFVPMERVVEVVDVLRGYRFEVSPEVEALYQENGSTGSAQAEKRTMPSGSDESDFLSVFRDSAPPGPPRGRAQPPPMKAPRGGDGGRGRAASRPAGLQVVRAADLPGGDPTAGRQAAGAGTAQDAITVSQLNGAVRQLLRQGFPESIWIVGEVVEYDRNAHREHVFFKLAEKEPGGDHVLAEVTTVIFRGVRPLIEERLREALDPIELKDGIEVRVRVRVDLYEGRGSYQVVVEDIDPSWTLGKLALRQQEILRELERLGIRERNLALGFPVLPLRLALITSDQSDAFNDFVNELSRSGYAFAVDLYDARMQGKQLEEEVLAGLAWFGRRPGEHDCLAIIRGGGARTDLMWFDSLPLARAVAEHPLKVICGIGHHRDRSVLDLISHSEKTPTAAAQFLVARVRGEEERILELSDRLGRRTPEVVEACRKRLREVAMGIRSGVVGFLRREEVRAGEARRRLRLVALGRIRRMGEGILQAIRRARTASSMVLARERDRTAQSLGRLAVSPARVIAPCRVLLDGLRARVVTGAPRLLRRAEERLVVAEKRRLALDPRRVLGRGYAILRRGDGRAIRSVEGVVPGDTLRAQVCDGTIGADVRFIEREGGDGEEDLGEDAKL